jgi:hypothetical protein
VRYNSCNSSATALQQLCNSSATALRVGGEVLEVRCGVGGEATSVSNLKLLVYAALS